jgi:hypothetical protein
MLLNSVEEILIFFLRDKWKKVIVKHEKGEWTSEMTLGGEEDNELMPMPWALGTNTSKILFDRSSQTRRNDLVFLRQNQVISYFNKSEYENCPACALAVSCTLADA